MAFSEFKVALEDLRMRLLQVCCTINTPHEHASSIPFEWVGVGLEE